MIKNNAMKLTGLLIGSFIVFSLLWASIILGLTNITPEMVLDSFFQFDGSKEHIIIQDTRVPRSLIAASIGASLAIAGAIMQGLTNNPLASPSLFGVNAGASFVVVLGISFFGVSSLDALTWLAFTGAAVSAIIVYVIGSVGREGLTPIKITLAGAAMAALLSSLTQGMLTLNEQALDQVLFWLAGSIQGRDLEILLSVLPYIVIGWAASFLIGRHINVLAMGEDMAKGLGQKTLLVKIWGGVIIVFLAGGAVAVTGPIGFIGIVIPHIARWMVGIDYRWILPYSGLLGAMLLLLADISARYVIMPAELPVGVMTALIGVPFFIYIARRGVNE
ncbi:FecCD family ABC transporter permease [Virgibacillus senegalensis]|uniref:FecCD family ABC transporter permease n=1 Tax=Virgibacillus senegalensis TaxID=1499679 RepID=UPI00069D24C9|nr:iron ABC transporter permease [Virgibacillus senegalensis]